MTCRYSPAARSDLRSIWRYTARTWTISQANEYLAVISTACDRVAAGSLSGRSAENYRVGYMMISIGSHFVFYKQSADGGIDIIRVLHRRMDLSSRLSD